MAAQQALRNLGRPANITLAEDDATREFLRTTNTEHAEAHRGNDELRARIAAYELAAKMQLAAPEVSDLSREPEHVHALYGTRDKNPLKAAYAKNCLLTRRFLEQGCASLASTALPGQVMSMGSSIGTHTVLSKPTTTDTARSLTNPRPPCSPTSSSVAYSMMCSLSGAPNSAVCRPIKLVRLDATTTRMPTRPG